jgi:hypothetical protein
MDQDERKAWTVGRGLPVEDRVVFSSCVLVLAEFFETPTFRQKKKAPAPSDSGD